MPGASLASASWLSHRLKECRGSLDGIGADDDRVVGLWGGHGSGSLQRCGVLEEGMAVTVGRQVTASGRNLHGSPRGARWTPLHPGVRSVGRQQHLGRCPGTTHRRRAALHGGGHERALDEEE